MMTVILAEPEATARWIWKREFECAGFTVSAVAQREELDRCLGQGTHQDVLILDRRLAGPSGEVVSRLRKDHSLHRPACFVLALLPSGPDRTALLQAGADWYIDKNALVSSLPRAVRAQVGPEWPVRSPARWAPRALVSLPVEYSHGGGVGAGETLNLSAEGMFLKTVRPGEPGDLVLLGFALPGARRWECFGRVVWNRSPADSQIYPVGMGIEFLALGSEEQAGLAAFVGATKVARMLPSPAPDPSAPASAAR